MTDAVIFCLCLIPISYGAYMDAKRRIIPNIVPIAIGALSVISGFLADSASPLYVSWLTRSMGLIPAAVMLLLSLRRNGIGGGDIKLCAALGFFLGFYIFTAVFLIAALVGFVWSQVKKEKYLPLGIFLAFGYLAVCAIILPKT